MKPSCPYCQRVLRANEDLKLSLNLIDISANSAKRSELIEKGGKGQVPYLEDTTRNISLYESLDIIDYLKEQYGNGQSIEVVDTGNVCPID